MNPLTRLAFLVTLLGASAFGATPIATVTSAALFSLDGHTINTPGVSSFPLVLGDTVTTQLGPAVLVFNDGSAMKLASNSSVRIGGVQAKPKIVLLSGSMDYRLGPNSALAVVNDPGNKSGKPVQALLASNASNAASAAAAALRAPAPGAESMLELHPGQIAARLQTPPGSTGASSGGQSASSSSNVFATYIGDDSTTLGNWKGKYGSDGELIASDVTNPPPYASVNLTGSSNLAIPADPNDARALQSAGGTTARIVTVYSNDFTIDLNLTDGNVHRVSLYLADLENAGRAETVTFTDAGPSKGLLSSQSFTSFSGGLYESWHVKGHVLIHVASTGKGNAIVNGIFFDAPLGPPPADTTNSGAETAPNSGGSIFTNPKFLIPLASAAAAGLAIGLLSLPPVSRNQ